MNGAKLDAKEIFLAALDCATPDELAGFLAESCAGDAALRARVEELLTARQEAGSFLGGNWTAATEAMSSVSEAAGTVIGPYKLLQQIGEGGMGVVFMAEQTEPLQRTVALKIIKPGMDTRQVIARFEAERQALAMMDHPNIARVLDAGTTGEGVRFQVSGVSEEQPALPLTPDARHLTPSFGRPYFVMDLVKGVPITDYCDAQHLPIRQRLELMTAVCHAVQHAHQKGIIHRDLKPSNVLVAEYDGRPVPKIIDFGVAKATAQRLTEKTMFTEYGQLIGTFEYMSPEQARFNQLDVDTRSDIYSLGVLLYEVLAGSTPLEKERLRSAAFDEVLRIICEEEPPKPSLRLSSSQMLPSISAQRQIEPAKLKKLVRGELDWIVMKCLEKDRNRRYETASSLAADIQHYLADEPVEARPATPMYRFKKFIRRNKAGVLAGSAIAAILLAAVVILLLSNARIRREATARTLALVAKDAALKDKDAALMTAREAVDRLLTNVASERFSNMPLSHPLRIALLEDAEAFYQRLAEQSASDASLGHKRATLLHTLAGILREVGRYDDAKQALSQSRDLLQELARTDPEPPTILEEQARVELDLAYTLHEGDEAKLATDSGAEAQYRRALALCDELERQWPDRRQPVVLGLRYLARLDLDRGNRPEALRQWRSAIARGEAYLEQHPGNVPVSSEIGWTCVYLFEALKGDSTTPPAEVEAVLTRGLAVIATVLDNNPQDMQAAGVRAALQIRLAMLRCRQGRVDDALPLFEQAITGMETLCEGFPSIKDYWNSLRWFHQEIVANLLQAGRPVSAQQALRQFQAWLEKVAPQMSKDAAWQEQVQRSQILLVQLQHSVDERFQKDHTIDQPIDGQGP